MTSQTVWIGITIGVFFAGLGIGLAVISVNNDQSVTMFHNRQMFNQMMGKIPKQCLG